MDDSSSQNKLITLIIHLFQSSLINTGNSIVHSGGIIQKVCFYITMRLKSEVLWPWHVLRMYNHIKYRLHLLCCYTENSCVQILQKNSIGLQHECK